MIPKQNESDSPISQESTAHMKAQRSFRLTHKKIASAEHGTPHNNIYRYIEEKTPIYLCLLDKKFLKELRGDKFHDSYFELLICALLTENCKATLRKPLVKKNTTNYDFHVTIDQLQFAVEVTNVNYPANGKDEIPHTILFDPEKSGEKSSNSFCQDKIQLRISSRIEEKLIQHTKLIEAGNISPDMPYIVAVGIYGLPNSPAQVKMFFSIEPHYLGAFFPVGDPIVYFEKQEQAGIELANALYHSAAPTVTTKGYNIKANFAQVSKNIFLDPKYSTISAVLLSSKADGWVMMGYEPGISLFNDLILIHNPMARNKLPQGVFPVFAEHVAELNTNTIKKFQPIANNHISRNLPRCTPSPNSPI